MDLHPLISCDRCSSRLLPIPPPVEGALLMANPLSLSDLMLKRHVNG